MDRMRGRFSVKDLIDDEAEAGRQRRKAADAEEVEEVPEEGPALLEYLNRGIQARKRGGGEAVEYDEDDDDDDEDELSEGEGL